MSEAKGTFLCWSYMIVFGRIDSIGELHILEFDHVGHPEAAVVGRFRMRVRFALACHAVPSILIQRGAILFAVGLPLATDESPTVMIAREKIELEIVEGLRIQAVDCHAKNRKHPSSTLGQATIRGKQTILVHSPWQRLRSFLHHLCTERFEARP